MPEEIVCMERLNAPDTYKTCAECGEEYFDCQDICDCGCEDWDYN